MKRPAELGWSLTPIGRPLCATRRSHLVVAVGTRPQAHGPGVDRAVVLTLFVNDAPATHIAIREDDCEAVIERMYDALDRIDDDAGSAKDGES